MAIARRSRSSSATVALRASTRSATRRSCGTSKDARRQIAAWLMVVLDVTIVIIALPSAQADLGFDADSRPWVMTAYALAFGSLLPLGGKVSDLIGRKWTFSAGVAGFAAASALGGAASSFGALVGARAMQGVFAALLAPAALLTMAPSSRRRPTT